MKTYFIFTFILVFSILAAAQDSTILTVERPKNPEINSGVNAAINGDTKAAESHFLKARQNDAGSRPGGIEAASAFADPKNGKPNFGKMRFWLEKTAEDFPEDPEAFLLLADIALSEDRLVESSMLTEHAAKLIDTDKVAKERQKNLILQAENIRADIAESRERWNDVLRSLQRLRVLEPENGNYLYRLGIVNFRSGNRSEAEKFLNEAAAKDKQILPALVVLAQLSEYDGKRDEAKKILDEALQKNGEEPRVLITAADLALLWGQLDNVKKYAEKAKKLAPETVDADIPLGIVALYEGNYTAAEENFSEVCRSFPDNSRALTGLALSLCEQDDKQKLRRAFFTARKNAEDHPNSVDAQTTLAWVLFCADAVEEAEKILMRLFENGELNSPGGYYLAEVHLKQNRKDEALIFLKSALESKAGFPKRTAAEALLKKLQEE
ncbi:MAG: tetratricopeptide repeat protein [Planctomycetaceae bacterium]|nr:tetratricopeptide repeat protein [Planctomycetaceae bacterium]